jgi:leucyl-tRNA synthetase
MQLKGKELETWIVQEILRTEEWKTSPVAKKLDISKAKKVIVVRGGKTINFVI